MKLLITLLLVGMCSVAHADGIQSMCDIKWGEKNTIFKQDEYFGNYGDKSYYWKQGLTCSELPGAENIQFVFSRLGLASISLAANKESADKLKEYFTESYGQPFRTGNAIFWNDEKNNIKIIGTYVNTPQQHWMTAIVSNTKYDTSTDYDNQFLGKTFVELQNFGGLTFGTDIAEFKNVKFDQEVNGYKVYSIPSETIKLADVRIGKLRLGFLQNKLTVIDVMVDKTEVIKLKNYAINIFGNSMRFEPSPNKISWESPAFQANLLVEITEDPYEVQQANLQVYTASKKDDEKKGAGERITIPLQGYDFIAETGMPTGGIDRLYLKKGSIKKGKKGIRSRWISVTKVVQGDTGDVNNEVGWDASYTVNCKKGTYSSTVYQITKKGFWEPLKDSTAPETRWESAERGFASGAIFERVCGKKSGGGT